MTIFSRVMPKNGRGCCPRQKTISVVANKTTTTNSVVHRRFPSIVTRIFPPPSLLVRGQQPFHELIHRIVLDIQFFIVFL